MSEFIAIDARYQSNKQPKFPSKDVLNSSAGTHSRVALPGTVVVVVFTCNCKVLFLRDCLHFGLSSSEVVFLQYKDVLEVEDGLEG